MLVENKKLPVSNEDVDGFNEEMDGDAVNYSDGVVFEEVGGIHNAADLRQEEMDVDEKEQGDEDKMV